MTDIILIHFCYNFVVFIGPTGLIKKRETLIKKVLSIITLLKGRAREKYPNKIGQFHQFLT